MKEEENFTTESQFNRLILLSFPLNYDTAVNIYHFKDCLNIILMSTEFLIERKD